jgi:signal transduction histidine kinase
MSYTPKILIVDDEPRLCSSLKSLLSHQGYEAHTSTGGKQAMESLAGNGFDLVLLDIVMPDVDGYQVMDYMDRRSLETPVIFITGHASVDSAVSALRGGAYDYLRKPLDYEELLKTVADAIDQKRRNNEGNEVSRRPLKAKEELEAVQRVKNELLARVSYTMRIPVNGVVGMAKLLLDTELTSEQHECAEMLRATAQSLLDMINGDLQLLQAEGDKFGLDIIDFDLPATMEALYDLLAERALKKGLQFTFIVHPRVPSRLQGDPRRLRQILFNLADNAIKFTEKGQVVIRVSLDEETDTHVTLRFAITDTGIGIAADRMNRLFDNSPFQANASMRPRHRGTGLGLVISKELAEMMGGKIGIKSREGKDSTFWLRAVFERQLKGKERPSALPSHMPTQRTLVAELDTALDNGVKHNETVNGTHRPEKGRNQEQRL